MAQRVNTVLISDMSGEEIAEGSGETVDFSVRGVEYRIDLNEREVKAFDKSVGTYIENAARVGGRRRSRKGGGSNLDREQLHAMREWGRENGFKVSERGRVSRELQEAFHASR